MRNFFIILSILLSHCSFAQFTGLKYISLEPATTVVTYKLKYQPDSTNPDDIRNSKLLLFIGPNISKIVNKAGYINDTTIRKFTTDAQVISYLTDPKTFHGSILYQIYKNYPKGKLTYTDHIPSDSYRFEESLDLFQWKLTGDTATISGFKSQRATCDFGGRNWIAWFSPDLPFSDGPYKFNGLPGLIVKVFDTRNHYVFELVAVNKLEPAVMIDIQDKQYINTTKQGFFQAWDSFRTDIVSRMKQAGGDNDVQQTIARNMKSDNNPIELKRK